MTSIYGALFTIEARAPRAFALYFSSFCCAAVRKAGRTLLDAYVTCKFSPFSTNKISTDFSRQFFRRASTLIEADGSFRCFYTANGKKRIKNRSSRCIIRRFSGEELEISSVISTTIIRDV